jgi:hypothetical protein
MLNSLSRTHILCSTTCPEHTFYAQQLVQKQCRLSDDFEKYGTAIQATDGNIIRRMRIANWVTKATDTHLECVLIIAFPR